MEELILFILCFIFVFIIYQVFIIIPVKRNKNKKIKKKKGNKEKEIYEVKYLQAKYKFDLNKVNYNKLLNICCFTSSFDIALIVSFMELIDNFFLKLIATMVFSVATILVSYRFVYLYLRRKMK